MKPKLKEAMDDACRALQAEGIQFDQVDDYQLKVGSWSFYPTKGTIFQDEAGRKDPRSGLAAFIAILKQHHLRPQRPALKPSSPRLVSDRVPARSSRPEHINTGGGEFMWEPAELPIEEIIITVSPEPAPDSSEPININIGGGEFMRQPAEPETILTLSPEPAPDSSRPPVQEVKLNPPDEPAPPPKKQPEPLVPGSPEEEMARMRHILQRQRQSNRAERGGS